MIVRPWQSTAETQPKLQPAFLRLSAMNANGRSTASPRACGETVNSNHASSVPSTSPSISSSFRNLTEPLIDTPRERRAPDCVGMDVRLNGPGTTDGSGWFVCGGSVRSRGAKRVKGCMARIVRNYATFRKRNLCFSQGFVFLRGFAKPWHQY